MTYFAYTLFTRSNVLDEINVTLKRFWEVETYPCMPEMQVVTKKEKLALEQVQFPINYDGERYEVQVACLRSRPLLENNYKIALKRLQNTEKRLLKVLLKIMEIS